MHKKRLVQLGHSSAFIIDKPILRRLGIKKFVDYQIEDGRLVIQRSSCEPVLEVVTGKDPSPKPKLRMELVLQDLESYGFDADAAAHLVGARWESHRGSMAYLGFWTKASNGQYGELVEHHLRTVLERREALGQLSRVPMRQTIDEVMAEFPEVPPEDNGVRFQHLL